jgi:hypothetical protein
MSTGAAASRTERAARVSGRSPGSIFRVKVCPGRGGTISGWRVRAKNDFRSANFWQFPFPLWPSIISCDQRKHLLILTLRLGFNAHSLAKCPVQMRDRGVREVIKLIGFTFVVFAGTSFLPLKSAHAQVSTSCTEAFNYCMSGGRASSRGNNDNSRAASCQKLRQGCMKSGEWITRFQQLKGLRRE